MYGAKTHATPHQWRMSFHNKTISLNYRVVSHPLGYSDISATRVTKSETSVFGISAMLKYLVVTCIRGSLYSTAVRCFKSGH